MVLLLLLLCAARVAAGATGGNKATHRYPRITTTTSLEDQDLDTDEAKRRNITQAAGEPTTRNISGPPAAAIMAQHIYTYGCSIMEAAVVGRPHVRCILKQGDAAEILAALCHPSRLIRSIVLSWVATEAWRQCGLFSRRRPKKQREGKKYRRFTSTRKTYKKKIKGLMEEPMDDEEELFQQEYARSRGSAGRRGRDRKPGDDTLSNLVPESQEKGNSLTKGQKENLLKKFEVSSRPGSRHKPPKNGRKRFGFKFPRLSRKKKFRVVWILGHMLSPCLVTPIGGAIAGWTGVLCVGAELIPWVDKKFKLDVLEDNELLEWLLEPFRDNDLLKALLFGSFVGACYSNM